MKVRNSAGNNAGTSVKHHLSMKTFPIGNASDAENGATAMPSGGSNVDCLDQDSGKRGVLFAQPHPYLDVSRLELSYKREPTWLFYTKEFLSSRALAVILTYPPDVPKLKTHFLRPLDFLEPYHVLAVSEKDGTQADHSQVLLLGRRGEGLVNVNLSFDPLPLRTPVDVARRLAPAAYGALLVLCGVERVGLEEELRGSRFNVFQASNSWTPWED